MKVREKRMVGGGMGGEHAEYRVIELPEDKKPKAHQEPVAEDTPLHGWQSTP